MALIGNCAQNVATLTFSSAIAFEEFDRSVRRELRYVRTAAQEEFLAAVIATAKVVLVKAGYHLWRAQLGHDWREEARGKETFKVPNAHPPARMKPLPEKATDGRVSPRGIACLYLATLKETATLEVRPLIGSYVSVGEFMVLRDIHVVDCTLGMDILAGRIRKARTMPEDREKTVWLEINNAFSKPVERGDSSLDYVPTQILAETFKRRGFDGIAYKSSYGEEGLNVALFDIGAADLIEPPTLYRIKDVSIEMEVEGDACFIAPN
jgi:RES domain